MEAAATRPWSRAVYQSCSGRREPSAQVTLAQSPAAHTSGPPARSLSSTSIAQSFEVAQRDEVVQARSRRPRPGRGPAGRADRKEQAVVADRAPLIQADGLPGGVERRHAPADALEAEPFVERPVVGLGVAQARL